ncbi:MAG TPA: hypothetical protein VM345_19480 [Acidimicrobiales bacterium]|jgi:hypothetical protein|nr:hypothetical protein [Acidimicrobiales bacterium]
MSAPRDDVAVFAIDHVWIPAVIFSGGWLTSAVVSTVSDDVGAVIVMCAWVASVAWTFFVAPWQRAERGATFGDAVVRRGVDAEFEDRCSRAVLPFEREFVRTVVDVVLLGILGVFTPQRRSFGERVASWRRQPSLSAG